jgi:hypothetical protein
VDQVNPRSDSPGPAEAPARGPRPRELDGRAGGIGPASSDQVPMPAQQHGRPTKPLQAGRGLSRASPASTARFASQPAADTLGVAALRPRAQHEQFGVLGRCASRKSSKLPHHLAVQQVDQPQSRAPTSRPGDPMGTPKVNTYEGSMVASCYSVTSLGCSGGRSWSSPPGAASTLPGGTANLLVRARREGLEPPTARSVVCRESSVCCPVVRRCCSRPQNLVLPVRLVSCGPPVAL